MDDNDLLYKIALTRVSQIGDIQAKLLIQNFQTAQAVFNVPKKQLEKIEGIGSIRAHAIKQFKDFADCEKEVEFLIKHKIQALSFNNEDYPQKLLRSDDCPSLIFYKGNAPLNQNKIISIVGTRLNTEYGKHCCENLIKELSSQQVIIVSGLAYGIDTIAHRAALKYGLNTIGILAHGLDRIYPSQNKLMAKQMTTQGGLLTEFCSGTLPNKQNFPKRNRITAGICDALVVIETGIKGGSLITAEIANSYNKDVFAFPGRINDNKSLGCNYLIKSNKACLINDSRDLIDCLKWNITHENKIAIQPQLFYEYNEQEKKIIACFKEIANPHFDWLYQQTQLSNSLLATSLLSLEMAGIITSLPGKRFKLNNY